MKRAIGIFIAVMLIGLTVRACAAVSAIADEWHTVTPAEQAEVEQWEREETPEERAELAQAESESYACDMDDTACQQRMEREANEDVNNTETDNAGTQHDTPGVGTSPGQSQVGTSGTGGHAAPTSSGTSQARCRTRRRAKGPVNDPQSRMRHTRKTGTKAAPCKHARHADLDVGRIPSRHRFDSK